jgi:hypothetical protein
MAAATDKPDHLDVDSVLFLLVQGFEHPDVHEVRVVDEQLFSGAPDETYKFFPPVDRADDKGVEARVVRSPLIVRFEQL